MELNSMMQWPPVRAVIIGLIEVSIGTASSIHAYPRHDQF